MIGLRFALYKSPRCLKHKLIGKSLRTVIRISNLNMSTSKLPKVFVTRNDYPEESIKRLKEKAELEIFDGTNITKEGMIQGVKGKQGLYCSLNDKVDKDILDSGNDLKVISTMSVGLDHIDLNECLSRNIKVGYTPGILTEAVAELGVALLLAASRRLFEAHDEVVKGGWSSWAPMWMCGQGLHGATVGIVGLGSIGAEIGRKLKSFRIARILYSSSSGNKNPAACELGATLVSLDELISESDFIIVTCALTETTKGLFNKKQFSCMKPSAIFVNISRGAVVVQEDLVDALKRKVIFAAGLDVMTPEPLPLDDPLLCLPNCVTLPHIGSATLRTRYEMGNLTTANLIAGLEGQPLPKEWRPKKS